LVDLLRANLERPLILLSAPAGYGKTTLLAQFAAKAPLPVVWYQLDVDDNDPSIFFEYLVEGIAVRCPDFGGTMRSVLQSIENVGSEWQRLLVVFVNELVETVSEDILVVLEDYHLIDNPLIHGFVDRLLARAPPQLHLALSTRTDPLISLARLRARRQVGEIRAEDLRFTAKEVRALLQDRADLELSSENIQTLAQETEGWAAALQLALLSVSRSQGAPIRTVIGGLSGTHRYLFDYLSEEVLRAQPPKIQSFLLESSVLDQMNPDLCDAVLEIETSQEILPVLDSQNLLIVQRDDRREWYRYHRLFREFLQQQLHRHRDRDDIQTLYLKAAAYSETVAEIDQAIAYYIAGHATDRLVALVEQTAPSRLARGRFGIVQRWLDAVPAETLADRPWLMLYRGKILAVRGRTQDAWLLLEQAREVFATAGNELGESRALAELSRMALFEGRYDESLELNHEAMICMPWTDHEGRNQALRDQAELWIYLGDAARALHAASESVAEAQYLDDQARLASSTISKGLMQVTAGQLSEGTTTLKLGLATLDAPDALGAHIAYAVLGSVHLYRWELDRAIECFEQSLALSQRFQDSTYAVYAHISMAIVHAERDELDQAQAHNDAALRIVEETQMRSLLGEGAWNYVAEWHAQVGRYAEAEECGRKAIAFRGDESRESAWGMGWLPLAKVYLATDRVDEAEKILLDVEAASEKGETAIPLIDSSFHLGRLYLETKRGEEATSHIRRALGAAAPEGHRWLILTHRRKAVPVLTHALKHAIEPAFVQDLLRELGEAAGPAQVELVGHPGVEVGRRAQEALLPSTAMALRVFTFGDFRVTCADKEVGEPGWLATKAGDLLAYFITVCDSSVPRDRVLEALWSEVSPESSSGSFHTALYKLRQMLRTSGIQRKFVKSRKGEYCLERELFWIDASEFTTLVAQCSRHQHESVESCEPCIERLQKAVDLYAGDYLHNLYYDWALDQQRHLQKMYLKVLGVLARYDASRDDYGKAIERCRQMLDKDPLLEDVHRQAMRYYSYLGDRNGMMRQYRWLEKALADELGVEPMPETQELYQTLVSSPMPESRTAPLE
jgi:LuxR family maltose regulon positive regulatory protein